MLFLLDVCFYTFLVELFFTLFFLIWSECSSSFLKDVCFSSLMFFFIHFLRHLSLVSILSPEKHSQDLVKWHHSFKLVLFCLFYHVHYYYYLRFSICYSTTLCYSTTHTKFGRRFGFGWISKVTDSFLSIIWIFPILWSMEDGLKYVNFMPFQVITLYILIMLEITLLSLLGLRENRLLHL